MSAPAAQPALFDARTTQPPKCPACGTTRVNLCEHEAAIAHGLKDALSSRPRGCLRSAQNRDGIPYA